MNRFIKISGLSLGVLAFGILMGCKGGGAQPLNTAPAGEDGGLGTADSLLSSSKAVSLKTAEPQDVGQYIVDCRNKKDNGKICVQICHRPPGNPENSKNMILPLQATLAHLNHGGPHHTEHDYLGPCRAHEEEPSCDDGTGSDDESSSDDGAGGSDDGIGGSDESSGDDGSSDDGDDVPVWCERNELIDADCDGFDDFTGESLY